jgi:hypothetical protein
LSRAEESEEKVNEQGSEEGPGLAIKRGERDRGPGVSEWGASAPSLRVAGCGLRVAGYGLREGRRVGQGRARGGADPEEPERDEGDVMVLGLGLGRGQGGGGEKERGR